MPCLCSFLRRIGPRVQRMSRVGASQVDILWNTLSQTTQHCPRPGPLVQTTLTGHWDIQLVFTITLQQWQIKPLWLSSSFLSEEKSRKKKQIIMFRLEFRGRFFASSANSLTSKDTKTRHRNWQIHRILENIRLAVYEQGNNIVGHV